MFMSRIASLVVVAGSCTRGAVDCRGARDGRQRGVGGKWTGANKQMPRRNSPKGGHDTSGASGFERTHGSVRMPAALQNGDH